MRSLLLITAEGLMCCRLFEKPLFCISRSSSGSGYGCIHGRTVSTPTQVYLPCGGQSNSTSQLSLSYHHCMKLQPTKGGSGWRGFSGLMSVHSFHLALVPSFFVIDLARYHTSTWCSTDHHGSNVSMTVCTKHFNISLFFLVDITAKQFTFLRPFMRSLLLITLPRASCAAHHLMSHFLVSPSSGGSGP